MRPPILLVGALAILLAGCTRLPEEVRVVNPCDRDLTVWLAEVAPPPKNAVGRVVPAQSNRLLTHDRDEPVQQVWIKGADQLWIEVDGGVDFSAYLGEDLTARYDLPADLCDAFGVDGGAKG